MGLTSMGAAHCKDLFVGLAGLHKEFGAISMAAGLTCFEDGD